MNLDRLKFAWARGARIQHWPLGEYSSLRWSNCDWMHVPFGDVKRFDYRIHPDDAHLEYGPLSSECLHIAIARRNDAPDYTPEIAACCTFVTKHLNYKLSDCPTTAIEWGMAYLFFAEYLADQGL